MPYEFLDHTADVAVALRSETREGLFAEALRAFTDTVTAVDRVDPAEGHDLEVEAPNLDELLVEWLGELVYRFDVDGLLFSEVADLAITATDTGFRLTGRARGEPYDEIRHPLKVEVKGVTYHELAIERLADGGEDGGDGDGGWRGRVIFDI